MAEETKKDEDAETVPEATATGADAPETAGADVVLEGETAVPAGNEDAGLDPVEALIAERDSLKDQLLRALADVENMAQRAQANGVRHGPDCDMNLLLNALLDLSVLGLHSSQAFRTIVRAASH